MNAQAVGITSGLASDRSDLASDYCKLTPKLVTYCGELDVHLGAKIPCLLAKISIVLAQVLNISVQIECPVHFVHRWIGRVTAGIVSQNSSLLANVDQGVPFYNAKELPCGSSCATPSGGLAGVSCATRVCRHEDTG